MSQLSTPGRWGVAGGPGWRPGSSQPRCHRLSRPTSRSTHQRQAPSSLERLLGSGPLCGAALLLTLPPAIQPGPHATIRGAAPSAPAAPAPRTSPTAYVITPERRALLDTIRFAEGTWKGGSETGYRVLYGGGLFASLERHPEVTVHRRYSSAAAGAYQFLPNTWREASRKLALRDFSPANQDQAALYLVERRGALEAVDRSGLGSGVLARLSREWASLPASHGGSHYGQPVKSREELISFYANALQRARQASA